MNIFDIAFISVSFLMFFIFAILLDILKEYLESRKQTKTATRFPLNPSSRWSARIGGSAPGTGYERSEEEA